MHGDIPLQLEHHGAWIVFLAVLIDQIGLPIPAMPVLILAGAVAASGRLSAPLLLWVAVLACLLADVGWFIIGRRYGMRVLKALCRISLEPDSCVSQTQGRFERWGANSLLFAKFIPGLSAIAPPLAGALQVGWSRYLVLSTIGAAAWALCGVGAGLLCAAQVDALLRMLERFGGLALPVIAALFLAYIGYKAWERQRFYAQLRTARISVADLWRQMQAGESPLIIDVRTHTARQLEPRWIPTAIHAPPDDLAGRIGELPRERDIVVYCTCPNEASAARVAKQLMSHGFQRVRPLLGGLDAWVEAGYEIARPTPAVARQALR